MVLDCTPAELNTHIAEAPVPIDAHTLDQLKQAKAMTQPKKKLPSGELTKWLATREHEKPFQNFLQKRYGRNATTAETTELAVKDLVGFGSRTQLDNDAELGMKFKKMIMLEFNAWLNN